MAAHPSRCSKGGAARFIRHSPVFSFYLTAVLREWHRRKPAAHSTFWNEALDAGHVWQRRFYDFVVWSEHKRIEKLRYMQRNPVKRGLVLEPDQWPWGSFRYYAHGERGTVLVNEQRRAALRIRSREKLVA